MLIQSLKQCAQFSHGSAVKGKGAMPTRSAHGSLDQATLFLSDHDGVELAPTHMHSKTTDLSQGIADALEQVCVVFNQVFSSVFATNLLIAQNGEYDVTGYRQAFGFSTQEGSQHHGYPAFHIQGSAAPNIAVCCCPSKWWVLPLLVLGGHDVDMPLK